MKILSENINDYENCHRDERFRAEAHMYKMVNEFLDPVIQRSIKIKKILK